MLYRLKKMLGLIPEFQKWAEMKEEALKRVLGSMHGEVLHAIIPFYVGGTLDLYYFPQHTSGTAIATQELISEEGKGPSNRVHRAYELCMFTRHALDLPNAQNVNTAFGKIHQRINRILNLVARYGSEEALNPGETAEFPP